MNGFKICLGTSTLSGPDIQDLLRRCERLNGTEPKQKGVGTTSRKNIVDDYTKYIIENIKPHMGKRKLKVVCDAGNGVGGMTGPTILRALGCEVIELYCEPDGNFPNHHPDPTVLKNIETLIKTVKETGADIGIGWDGDADRIGAVDEKGNVIFGDMLVLIFGRAILAQEPGATIIGDVKCSKLLFDDLAQKGGTPIMWKTGHSLIKAKLKETGGALAGEMSGHIFFKNRFYGFDDAIYASCRLIEILSNTETKASALLADLPKTVSTPEIRFDCPEEIKFKVPELAKKAFDSYTVDTTDGARITFEHGWGLIRASNTQPVLVMRFEATTEDELKKYQSIVNTTLEQIISSLR
jgi:phosphomannomutase/phosphoglucomutase